jgi:hypothetical protein
MDRILNSTLSLYRSLSTYVLVLTVQIQPFLSTRLPSNQDYHLPSYSCRGASGSVCYADAGYAVKLAMWKGGKEMIGHEALLYEMLLPLQGLCVPKLYGLFRSEMLEVLVLEFMGRSFKSIEELNIEQRWAVPSDYSLLHLILLKTSQTVPL